MNGGVNQDLIYDIGMHNGNDSAFYLTCGFRVVAIEADPVAVEAGQKRFAKEIAEQKLTVLNIGVSDTDGSAEFWINETRSQWNSFNRELTVREGEPCHSVVIPCKRLDTILREFGMPYYLKIDIEGNDLICCNQLSAEWKPKFISVEMLQIELLLRLRDLGYDRFKLIMQLDFQPVAPKPIPWRVHFSRFLFRSANYRKQDRSLSLRIFRTITAKALQLGTCFGLGGRATTFRSKRMPDWKFIEGSSGSFGDDLPGEWHSWQEIAYLWHRDQREYEKLGIEFWCDLHATYGTKDS